MADQSELLKRWRAFVRDVEASPDASAQWQVLFDAALEGHHALDFERAIQATRGALEVDHDTARAVFQREYYQRIKRVADSIVEAVNNGEIDTDDGLSQRLDEEADSAMTYVYDAVKTIFASQNDDSGFDELGEALLDGVGTVGEVYTRIGYYAFRTDVLESLPEPLDRGDVEGYLAQRDEEVEEEESEEE